MEKFKEPIIVSSHDEEIEPWLEQWSKDPLRESFERFRKSPPHAKLNEDKINPLAQYLRYIAYRVERIFDETTSWQSSRVDYLISRSSALGAQEIIEPIKQFKLKIDDLMAYVLFGFWGFRTARWVLLVKIFSNLINRMGELEVFLNGYIDYLEGGEACRVKLFSLCRIIELKQKDIFELAQSLMGDSSRFSMAIQWSEDLNAAVKGILTPINQGLPAAAEAAAPPPAQDTETEVEYIDLYLSNFRKGDIRTTVIGLIDTEGHKHSAGDNASNLMKNIRRRMVKILDKYSHKGKKIAHREVFRIFKEDAFIKLEYKGRYRFRLINKS